MSNKKIDFKWVGFLVAVIILAFVVKNNRDVIINSIGHFFQKYDHLAIHISLVSGVIILLQKIKSNEFSGINWNNFSEIAEKIKGQADLLVEPVALASAFTLLRALFLHSFEKESFFPLFDTTEITFLWAVAAFILFQSFTDLVKKFIDLAFSAAPGNVRPAGNIKASMADGVSSPAATTGNTASTAVTSTNTPQPNAGNEEGQVK